MRTRSFVSLILRGGIPTTGGSLDIGLPLSVQHAAAPVLATLRWAAVGYALLTVSPDRTSLTWTDVVIIAVCVFLTTLRTMLPLTLGDRRTPHRWVPYVDIAVFSAAVGWTGETSSPWLFCSLVAVAVAAFGWGTSGALYGGTLAIAFTTVAVEASGGDLTTLATDVDDALVALALAVTAAGAIFLRGRAVQGAIVVRAVSGELTTLRMANNLLSQLADVALTLPGSFTLREALGRIRTQIDAQLDPRVTALLTLDEHTEEWTPKITDRCAMRAGYPTSELPEPLRDVLETGEPMVRSEPHIGTEWEGPDDTEEWMGRGSTSGLYLPLQARGRIIGLLAVEHSSPHHFDAIDPAMRDGLADVIALTVDNARWFGRLRSLGAEEERIRVARDIHDRIGQWMTFIKLELERLSNSETVDPEELRRLDGDASAALDELRETLRQLRSGVSDDRPLAVLGSDLADQFSARTQIPVQFTVADPEQRLPVPVENELLRILQEALNNVDRHASAEHVEVDWVVDGGNFELTVIDDGRGFDADRAVREQSYGVIGMRERADVIGASFDIDSEPGGGTRLCVRAGRTVATVAPAGGQ